MVPSLVQGRIVFCRKPIADPQGGNPKANRPFVVITHPDDIQGAQTIQGVAITDQLSLSPKEHYYPLPTGEGAKLHGCSRGSAALCTWIVSLSISDLDVSNGCLKLKYVYSIVEKVRELKPGVFQSRAPGESAPST